MIILFVERLLSVKHDFTYFPEFCLLPDVRKRINYKNQYFCMYEIFSYCIYVIKHKIKPNTFHRLHTGLTNEFPVK